MRADKLCSGSLHAVDIKRLIVLILKAVGEDVRNAAGADAVALCFGGCIVTAVEALIHALYRKNRNIVREILIHI